MYARSTTVHADPQRIDDGIANVRDEVMPAVQSMPGCMGVSMPDGGMLLTVIPDEAYSRASDLVKAITAPFDAA